MKYRIKHKLLLFFLMLITLTNCSQKQEKEDQEKPLQQYEKLNTTVNDTKQYIGQMDSALFQLSIIENNPNSQDSAERSIRSRDQDMVRIYKIEKKSIVDTASVDLDHLINEAYLVLEKSSSKIQEAREQVEHHINEENNDSTDSQTGLIEDRDANIKEINRLIDKLEAQGSVLKKQLNSINTPSR